METGSRPVRLVRWGQQGLVFLKKGPDYTLTFANWQINRWMRRAGLRKLPWLIDDSAFWAQLDLDARPLAQVTSAVQSGSVEEASCALLDYFSHRQTPCFFVGKAGHPLLLDLIGPQTRAATVGTAEQVVRRTFTFREQPPITFELFSRNRLDHCQINWAGTG